MTLVIRTARLPAMPSDGMRVTRRGGWLGLPDQLPRCYLELREAPASRHEPPRDRHSRRSVVLDAERPRCADPEYVRKWRAALRSFLRSLSTTHPEQWRALFAHTTVTLLCCCKEPPCARWVIAEFLAEQGAFVDREALE